MSAETQQALIQHAARLTSDALSALDNPQISDQDLRTAGRKLKLARREIKVVRGLKRFPMSEGIAPVSPSVNDEVPEEEGDPTKLEEAPRRPLQEQFIIAFLGKADRGELEGDYFHAVAQELYEQRPHEPSVRVGNAIGGIAGGLYKAEGRIINQLEQHLSNPELANPTEYVRKILAAAHTVPGHEQMTAQELLDFLKESKKLAAARIPFIPAEIVDVSNAPVAGASEPAAEAYDAPAGSVFESIRPFIDGSVEATPPLAPMEKKPRLAEGARKPLVILTALEPNDDGTEPRYTTRTQQAETAYADLLKGPTGRELKAKIESYGGCFKGTVDDFVNILRTESSKRPDSLLKAQTQNREILEMARQRWPEVYGNSSDAEIIAILANELPFPNRKPELFAGIHGGIVQLIVNLEQAAAAARPQPAPAPEVEEAPKRKSKTKLEIFEGIHGNRRARIFLSLIERNESKDNFRFKENDDVIEHVYKDELAKYKREDAKGQCLKALKLGFIWSREYCIQKLAEYAENPDGPNKETIEAWLREATERLGLETPITPGRLIYVLRRHISFADISNPDPKFDKIEWNDAHDMIITYRREIRTRFANAQSTQTIRSGGDSTIAAAYKDGVRASFD